MQQLSQASVNSQAAGFLIDALENTYVAAKHTSGGLRHDQHPAD